MTTKEILKIIPTIQSINIVKTIKKKKRKPVKNAVDIIVGSSLIDMEGEYIGLM